MIMRFIRFSYPAALARAMMKEMSGPAELAVFLKGDDRTVAGDGEDLTVEERLSFRYIRFGKKIANSLPERESRLVRTYLGRGETENLKLLVRRVFGESREDISELMMPLPYESRFSFDRLLEADSTRKLHDLLPAGEERNLIGESLGAPAGRALFHIETALDRLFWARVRECATRLAYFDRLAAEEILGMRADLDRFRVIRRGLLPGPTAGEIVGALPCMGNAFPASKVLQALDSEEREERLKKFPPLAGLESPFSGEGEAFLLVKMRKNLWKILRSPPFDISASLSALLLKELETRDLQAVLSGRRLGLDKDRVFPFLSIGEG